MSNKPSARQRLLNAAAELFYRDGVGATGIDAITAHAGVAKMSLYNNFTSKADLVAAYIDMRRAEWRQLLEIRLRAASSPRERILAVFDSYLDHAECAFAWGFRGCGLLNAASELPVGDRGRFAVAAQKAEVEELFARDLGELLPAAAEVAELAAHLSFLLEGAMSRAGLEGNDKRLNAARKIAVSMLDQLESQC